MRKQKTIKKEFSGKVGLMIFDKDITSDISSTIVDLSTFPYKILREGSVLFKN